MSLDYRRDPKRFRVYITPPDGREVLWDDCDTVAQATELGESTFCPFRILDRRVRPDKKPEWDMIASIRALQQLR